MPTRTKREIRAIRRDLDRMCSIPRRVLLTRPTVLCSTEHLLTYEADLKHAIDAVPYLTHVHPRGNHDRTRPRHLSDPHRPS